MADDTTTTTETEEKPAERTVPYNRFKEVNDKLAAERQARAELEERMSTLEDRDKSDVERLTKEVEKLQKRAAEAESQAAELSQARERDAKSALIANAAAQAKFHDPSLVAQIVNLEEIDDAKSAAAAVKQIAKERPYLVQSESPERQRLARVGIDGSTIDEAKEKGLVTEEDQKRAWGEQMFAGLTGQAPEKQQQI